MSADPAAALVGLGVTPLAATKARMLLTILAQSDPKWGEAVELRPTGDGGIEVGWFRPSGTPVTCWIDRNGLSRQYYARLDLGEYAALAMLGCEPVAPQCAGVA